MNPVTWLPVLIIGVTNALFVPEQLPTLLSFLYSNVPPIRKGHDSRLGVGFRLGNNADFQIQFELGPQESTLPLGQDGGSNKRQVNYFQVPEQSLWLYRWKQEQDDKIPPWEEKRQNSQLQVDRPKISVDIMQHLSQLYKEQPNSI